MIRITEDCDKTKKKLNILFNMITAAEEQCNWKCDRNNFKEHFALELSQRYRLDEFLVEELKNKIQEEICVLVQRKKEDYQGEELYRRR